MDATEAAVHFSLALQRAGIPHAIGGAIAYGFFGAARRTREVRLHDRVVPVLSPEDTAVFKMLFFRGKDLVDVERLLALMGHSLDVEYVRAALLEVVGDDDYRTRKWDELTQDLAT